MEQDPLHNKATEFLEMPQITWTDRFGESWTWTSNKLKPLVKPTKTEHQVKQERKASVGRVQETVKRMNSSKNV